MSNSVITPEKEKVCILVEQYKNDGFEVVVEPSLANLPFDLGGYRPDIVAQKEGVGFIIEVKRSSAKLSVERFKSIAEEVRKHPGWRFLLVTADDIFSGGIQGQDALSKGIGLVWKIRHDNGNIQSQDAFSLQQITDRFSQAKRLFASGELEPAFLILWISVEGLLRTHALQIVIPIERFPISTLIKHLYSEGELSMEQFDILLSSLEARNQLVHGYALPQVSGEYSKLCSIFSDLLSEWNLSSSTS